MILSQVSYKSVQNLLKSIPCDLQIICEDKKVFSSHKLLFGLLNTTLANLFLEEDFANENITLFLPIKSELLYSIINDEFGLKRKIEEIFLTSPHCAEESESIELIETEGNVRIKEEEPPIEAFDNVEEGELIVKPTKLKPKKEKKKKKEGIFKVRKTKVKDKDPGPIPCEDCGKMFGNINSLKMHRKNYHENPGIILKCEKCSYTTVHQHILKDHIKNQHESDTLQCNECGKSFYGTKLYKAHVFRMHSEDGQEMEQCKECGLKTKKYGMKQHVAHMHMARNFACQLCNYKAQTGYNLKLHVTKSHLGIKELPKHKCPHCETVTTNLEYHIKSSHKDKN